MLLSTKSLVLATAAVVALTGFDLRPVAAAPLKGPATVQANAGDEFSSQRRRHRRGVNPAVPLAAFGAIVGTIGAIAESQRRREYYDRHYYNEAPVVYDAPQVYRREPRVYHHPNAGYAGPRAYRNDGRFGPGEVFIPPPQSRTLDSPGSM